MSRVDSRWRQIGSIRSLPRWFGRADSTSEVLAAAQVRLITDPGFQFEFASDFSRFSTENGKTVYEAAGNADR